MRTITVFWRDDCEGVPLVLENVQKTALYSDELQVQVSSGATYHIMRSLMSYYEDYAPEGEGSTRHEPPPRVDLSNPEPRP